MLGAVVLLAACAGDEDEATLVVSPDRTSEGGAAGSAGRGAAGATGAAGRSGALGGVAGAAGSGTSQNAAGSSQAGGGQGGVGTGGGLSAGGAGTASGAAGTMGGSAGAGGAAGKPGAAGAAGTTGKAGAAGAPEPPLPVCDCFVKEAWCGSGVQKKAASLGCTVPLLPAHADDILACPGGKWAVKEACAVGCIEAPAGTADACKPAPCDLAIVKPAAYLKYGLHPDASDALAQIGLDAGDLSQTIGSATASAGTHDKDGVAEGKDYSAATDIRVVGLTTAQIKTRLAKLAEVGFAAWYRWPGHDGWPASEAPHIHAIWVGAKMKLSLRDQVRDWIVGKNGLQSHTTYTFYTWEKCRRDAIWERYLTANPAKG